jgi:hypothetical protein
LHPLNLIITSRLDSLGPAMTGIIRTLQLAAIAAAALIVALTIPCAAQVPSQTACDPKAANACRFATCCAPDRCVATRYAPTPRQCSISGCAPPPNAECQCSAAKGVCHYVLTATAVTDSVVFINTTVSTTAPDEAAAAPSATAAALNTQEWGFILMIGGLTALAVVG